MLKDNQKPVVIEYEPRKVSAEIKNVYIFDDRDSAAEFFAMLLDSGKPALIMVATLNPEFEQLKERANP